MIVTLCRKAGGLGTTGHGRCGGPRGWEGQGQILPWSPRRGEACLCLDSGLVASVGLRGRIPDGAFQLVAFCHGHARKPGGTGTVQSRGLAAKGIIVDNSVLRTFRRVEGKILDVSLHVLLCRTRRGRQRLAHRAPPRRTKGPRPPAHRPAAQRGRLRPLRFSCQQGRETENSARSPPVTLTRHGRLQSISARERSSINLIKLI